MKCYLEKLELIKPERKPRKNREENREKNRENHMEKTEKKVPILRTGVRSEVKNLQ